MHRAYAGRPIRADLLADRQVQTHVQEGIGIAGFGGVIALERLGSGPDHCVVFRVQLDHRGDLRVQRLEWQSLAMPAPGLSVERAEAIATHLVKERHGRAGQFAARTLVSASARVLWR